MDLLAIEHTVVLDRAVPAPIPYSGESITGDVVDNRPVVQYDRLRRRDPSQPTRRHHTIWLADGLADRHEMAVTAKAHVDVLGRLPELNEGRIEVEVDTHRDMPDEYLVGQHAGDVDQDVSTARD